MHRGSGFDMILDSDMILDLINVLLCEHFRAIFDDNIGRGLVVDPVHEFFEFLAQDALFALEHGDREVTQ